jgi:hypothetical protein
LLSQILEISRWFPAYLCSGCLKLGKKIDTEFMNHRLGLTEFRPTPAGYRLESLLGGTKDNFCNHHDSHFPKQLPDM